MARLAGISLFKDAGIDLAPFEARSHWRKFCPDEILVDFDDLSTDVYFLCIGEVRILIRTPSGKVVFASKVVADRLFRVLTARVRELNLRLMEQAVLDLRHRLYSELLRLSAPRAGHPSERVVTPPPYHHILAARIGCRREQVTREFTTMAHEGLIERTRGALVLKRPDVFEIRVAEAMREDA